MLSEMRQSSIRASIQPRTYGLKRRERTNRLLTLMQLHGNGYDPVYAYTHLIRASLEAHDGRPATDRRAIVDPRHARSLRLE